MLPLSLVPLVLVALLVLLVPLVPALLVPLTLLATQSPLRLTPPATLSALPLPVLLQLSLALAQLLPMLSPALRLVPHLLAHLPQTALLLPPALPVVPLLQLPALPRLLPVLPCRPPRLSLWVPPPSSSWPCKQLNACLHPATSRISTTHLMSNTRGPAEQRMSASRKSPSNNEIQVPWQDKDTPVFFFGQMESRSNRLG
jgi:hypothetical protein